jgi:hypothetical protein
MGMLPTNDDLEFIRLNRNKRQKFILRMNEMRNRHASRLRLSEQIGNFREGLDSLFGVDSEKAVEIMLKICSAHTDKSDTRLGDLAQEERIAENMTVRTLLVASLLRYGDELDVGIARALPYQYYELNVIPDDQQAEHIKHLAIKEVILKGNGSSLVVTFVFDAGIVTNVQVLRNIFEFMKKVEVESRMFAEMVSRYKRGVTITRKMLGLNGDEIDRLFAKVEELKLIASYWDDNHHVIRFSEKALLAVYGLKREYTSYKIKYLIVTTNGVEIDAAYERHGAKALSSLNLTEEIPKKILEEDLYCHTYGSDADVASIYHSYYPDLYILDMRGLPDERVELEVYKKKVVSLIKRFCTTDKKIDGRLFPFVIFFDDSDARLEERPDIYLQIMENLKTDIENWNAIAY